MPTYSHQAIKVLCEKNIAKYVLTSNHDNIHRKTGIPEEKMGELFGNAYIEECLKCHALYERKTQVPTLGRVCENEECKGRLVRTGVRFGQNVPEEAIKKCSKIAKACDLAIIIGSSMTVDPFCSFASTPKKYVIINLQETPYDSYCTLKIHAKSDDVMRTVMKALNLDIGSYEYKQVIYSFQTFKGIHYWSLPFKF
jgi:NAD-dependent SIR2 family protein deacetylase